MRTVLIVLCACLTASFVRADDASKKAKIEELLTVSQVERLFAQQQSQLRGTMHQMIVQMAPASANDPRLAKVEEVAAAEASAALDFQTLKPDLIRIYDETYTEEELDGLVKFYQSPTGQAFISKMPMVLAKSMELVQQRMAVMMPRMQERMKEIVAPEPKEAPTQQ